MRLPLRGSHGSLLPRWHNAKGFLAASCRPHHLGHLALGESPWGSSFRPASPGLPVRLRHLTLLQLHGSFRLPPTGGSSLRGRALRRRSS